MVLAQALHRMLCNKLVWQLWTNNLSTCFTRNSSGALPYIVSFEYPHRDETDEVGLPTTTQPLKEAVRAKPSRLVILKRESLID